MTQIVVIYPYAVVTSFLSPLRNDEEVLKMLAFGFKILLYLHFFVRPNTGLYHILPPPFLLCWSVTSETALPVIGGTN